MGSTRNDGMPTPDPDSYRLLVALAWLAALFVEVFGTAVCTGVRQTALDRAGYWPSWATCCWMAGVATLVFYFVVFAAWRHGGRAAAAAKRRERQSRFRTEAELRAEERRGQLFGRKLPMTIAVTPALWTVPVTLAGTEALPKDPVTGQNGADPSNVVTGILLAVVALGLWSTTGRLLAASAVAVWLPWAVCTEFGHLVAADVVGYVGLFALAVTVPVIVAIRRRRTAGIVVGGISSTSRRG